MPRRTPKTVNGRASIATEILAVDDQAVKRRCGRSDVREQADLFSAITSKMRDP